VKNIGWKNCKELRGRKGNKQRLSGNPIILNPISVKIQGRVDISLMDCIGKIERTQIGPDFL
jgi:hypothetical protein